jgi:Cu(I)/Ag(I) efflux system membrane fusion protein
MVKHNLNRILVVAVTMLAFVVSAAVVTQAFAQACPKTCPMKTGKGSEASCPMMKSGNSGKFLKPYFEMRNLLTRDKTEGVGALAKKLAANAKSLRAELKKDKAAPDQLDALRKIESAASAFKAADIKVARERFKSVSTSVVKYVQGFGYGGSAYVYYCDMAKAAWVQETDTIGNPYYGSEMPKCGTLVGRVADGKYDAESATPVKIEGKTM